MLRVVFTSECPSIMDILPMWVFCSAIIVAKVCRKTCAWKSKSMSYFFLNRSKYDVMPEVVSSWLTAYIYGGINEYWDKNEVKNKYTFTKFDIINSKVTKGKIYNFPWYDSISHKKLLIWGGKTKNAAKDNKTNIGSADNDTDDKHGAAWDFRRYLCAK